MTDPTAVVYFVRIGKFVKIGFTTNLDQRLKSFATSTAEPIDVLTTMPGGRDEERRLHLSLAELRRPRGEFFHFDFRISIFIDLVESGDIAGAWRALDEMHPSARKRNNAEQRRARDAERRMTKLEFDTYCAQLVSERKRTVGW